MRFAHRFLWGTGAGDPGGAARRSGVRGKGIRVPDARAGGNGEGPGHDGAGNCHLYGFVQSGITWISSNHVVYHWLWIVRGHLRVGRRPAPRVVTGVVSARRCAVVAVVNAAATLANSRGPQPGHSDCAMFAVTDIGAFRAVGCTVCRVSAADSGYGDALVNSGRIAVAAGGSELNLSLLGPNVSRPGCPIVANKESMPQEAEPRRRNARMRTPCGAPGQENYTSRCVSGFPSVFVPKV
ncbi:hypothetical protein DFR74_112121 [Nocardia puris]|uniref:Uncharacterized protein n=1 Tax=Nocardia puris TaxID=208602 RepID=A0A366DAA5_9NOCA|nr:hypothetical protein DFR74_112121 [Nocardia puris]